MHPRLPHSIDDFLADGSGAGMLIAHAGLLHRLQRIHSRAVPDYLARGSRVANYRSGAVVIHAQSGAVAVKLRQMAPTLCREFAKRGVECSDVTVKVQAFEISDYSPAPTPRRLPAAADSALRALSGGMAASPLRTAIETLLARSLPAAQEER